MIIKYYRKLKDPKILQQILKLLTECNGEFVPPLSERESTTQQNLTPGQGAVLVPPLEYFETIKTQSALVAFHSTGMVAGFLSFFKDYVSEDIPPLDVPNIYISTIAVFPYFRRHGITNQFYRFLLKKYSNCHIYTRTWSTNHSHLRILSSMKFFEIIRKENDRGDHIDTLYYHHPPTSKSVWQIIRQYRMVGNVFFFLLLLLLSVVSILLWAFSSGGLYRDLTIAIATSLMASALCLLSDTILKFRESKNDEYISTLKNFGIDNLQFNKDQLLETILPRCRHEVWISGYRLVMTAKAPFRASLKEACRNHRGLHMKVLLVPPWSESFRAVYGDEDVSSNYLKVLSDLADCVEQYGLHLEVRLSEKPLFNDTYKVDDRFVTGPYLHCADKANRKITAKDFFSLDINDPRKELYDLIYKDYMAVWESCAEEMDFILLRNRLARLGQQELTKEERLKLLMDHRSPTGSVIHSLNDL